MDIYLVYDHQEGLVDAQVHLTKVSLQNETYLRKILLSIHEHHEVSYDSVE